MDGGGDLILIGCLVRWLVTWLALFVPELRKSGKMYMFVDHLEKEC